MHDQEVKEILTKQDIIEILLKGKMDLQGQFTLGSNYTFLVNLTHHDKSIQAVYKPLKGEMPLWDFPPETLGAREAAAYIISEALDWELVPPTAIRDSGAFGGGSLQLFIPHDPNVNYFSFERKDRLRLKQTALFDVVINNADRKGSHIILDENDHIWLIDHGLSFHAIPKLRTVIWDFAGQVIDVKWIKDLEEFLERLLKDAELKKSLRQYLGSEEIAALKSRILYIISHPVFPSPEVNKRQFPWPLV